MSTGFLPCKFNSLSESIISFNAEQNQVEGQVPSCLAGGSLLCLFSKHRICSMEGSLLQLCNDSFFTFLSPSHKQLSGTIPANPHLDLNSRMTSSIGSCSRAVCNNSSCLSFSTQGCIIKELVGFRAFSGFTSRANKWCIRPFDRYQCVEAATGCPNTRQT